MLTIEQLEDNIRKESEIRCPHCEVLQPNDDMQYTISYHGNEDGPEAWQCYDCEKEFFVREIVRRTYDVAIDSEDL